MREEIHFWFRGFDNEEGFCLGEVPTTKVRKRRIDINVISSVVNLKGRREVFSESVVLMIFLYVWLHFPFCR